MEKSLEARNQRNAFFFLFKVSKKRKEFEMHLEIKLHSKFLLFCSTLKLSFLSINIFLLSTADLLLN